MRAIAVLLAALALASAQYQHEQYHQTAQQAAILTDARYLAGDGTFGAAYSQEDGVEFKEESDEHGNRRGSYSYVDPTGQRRTVTYTAGKNGFQASGDHIPTAPPQVPPQPEYVPLAQYNPPDYQPPAYLQRVAPSRPAALLPQYRPRPTYQPTDYEVQPEYETQPRFRSQYRPVPSPAPPPPPPPTQFRYRPRFQQVHHSELDQIPSYAPAERYQPIAPRVPPPQYNALVTPPPTRRFYPPGKLDFNRTPDGYSYTFSKN